MEMVTCTTQRVCMCGYGQKYTRDASIKTILILTTLSNLFIVDDDLPEQDPQEDIERIWYLMGYCGIFGHYLKKV